MERSATTPGKLPEHRPLAEKRSELVVVEAGSASPAVLPLNLRFDQGMQPPRWIRQDPWRQDSPVYTWLQTIPGALLLGDATSQGFWIISQSRLEAAITEARSQQQRQAEKVAEIRSAAWEKLKLAYDHDGSGAITGLEFQEAMIDPLFLEYHLPVIDSNHDGFLEAAELTYFDADGDGKLAAREEQAINLAFELLVAELIFDLDANQDGVIDFGEAGLSPSPRRSSLSLQPQLNSPDRHRLDLNRDGRLSPEELSQWLQRQCRASLLVSPGQAWKPSVISSEESNPGVTLRTFIEMRWRTKSSTRRPE
jgi:hypothetical protein